jgi:serine/threonine-protein kinase
MNRPTALLTAILLSSAVTMPSIAAAQPPAKNGTDPAAATALFYEARTLMKKGNYSAACPKLEESLRLDYGIGTEFNLADCNEHLGKVASAWSGFLNAAAAAKTANQPQREKVARDRAKALEPKLPKLVIDVPSPPSGIEVKRDGVTVGSAAWGTPVPVDPGIHKIVVTAPGKDKWESSVTLAEAASTHVTVPRELPSLPVAAAPKPAVVPVPAAAPPVVAPPVQYSSTTEAPPAAPPADFPEPVVERGSTQRTIGWVASAAGLAGLGVGAGFGIYSLAKRNEAESECTGDLCSARGVSLRNDAMDAGNVSTITTIAGGAALVSGIVLLLTAPRGTERADTTSAKTKFHAVPHVAVNGGGFSFQGVLP